MAKEKGAQESVEMEIAKKCKSCVRFENKGEAGKRVGSSFYLQNETFQKLGEPEKIMITVEPA